MRFQMSNFRLGSFRLSIVTQVAVSCYFQVLGAANGNIHYSGLFVNVLPLAYPISGQIRTYALNTEWLTGMVVLCCDFPSRF